MNTDLEDQEDELLALHSILGLEEFVRNESNPAGEIRVSVELPADFTVSLTEGEVVRRYEISFLPPLLLTFELPENYPSSSPPSFTLACSWLTDTQLSALGAQLTDLYQATGGAVVLFSWVQFLREDALRFLDISTHLELPSDEHSPQRYSQDSHNPALSETKNNQDIPKSGSTDVQSCNGSDHPAPSLEVQHPIVILPDGQNPPTLDGSSTDSQAVSKVSRSGLNSGSTNDSNQTAQASDAEEADQTLQTSELKANVQKDLSSTGGESKLPPLSESDQIHQGSSGGQEAAPLPVHPGESFQNKEQTASGPSLTPSQTLLSQLLIYDAAQKQKAFATTVLDCGVCFVGWLGSECVQLPVCGHIFCKACLAEFCKLQITEGNVRGVTCPQADCTGSPTPAQVKSLVGEELFSRYDRLLLQSTLDLMSDVVYCPRRSCGSAVIQEKSSTAAMCSVCGFAFCVTCRKTYHGTDDCQTKKKIENNLQQGKAQLPQSQEGMKALWDDYAGGSKQRRLLLQSRYGRGVLEDSLEDSLSTHWMEFNSKYCPHCFCRIQKNRGCNVMTCSQCKQRFCWVCLARLPTDVGTHFAESPSCLLEHRT
ncbi:E3 ubiquitin-protein ligase RNF14-like [Trachinotus anak]|uniref:E3 ubiquitin-protein ligase RNF14-like n=1 Tax=Trachinotus anak TaxID=443729 RepID=UPI0039F1D418